VGTRVRVRARTTVLMAWQMVNDGLTVRWCVVFLFMVLIVVSIVKDLLLG
jgi:hypothetical protein